MQNLRRAKGEVEDEVDSAATPLEEQCVGSQMDVFLRKKGQNGNVWRKSRLAISGHRMVAREPAKSGERAVFYVIDTAA